MSEINKIDQIVQELRAAQALEVLAARRGSKLAKMLRVAHKEEDAPNTLAGWAGAAQGVADVTRQFANQELGNWDEGDISRFGATPLD